MKKQRQQYDETKEYQRMPWKRCEFVQAASTNPANLLFNPRGNYLRKKRGGGKPKPSPQTTTPEAFGSGVVGERFLNQKSRFKLS
jgi:hypothetical protein